MISISYVEQEAAKYLKRKKSSVSKSSVKSKHKHIYKDVLFVCENKPHKGKYCTLCGKIGDLQFFLSEKRNGYYHVLTTEELYAKFGNLDVIEIENTFQKYIVMEDL